MSLVSARSTMAARPILANVGFWTRSTVWGSKVEYTAVQHVCCVCLLGPTQASRSALSACFKPGCITLLWPPGGPCTGLHGCCCGVAQQQCSQGLLILILPARMKATCLNPPPHPCWERPHPPPPPGSMHPHRCRYLHGWHQPLWKGWG